MKTVPCKGCGKPIVWGKDGRTLVPLDPAPPVYSKACELTDGTLSVVKMARGLVFVSHFVTCPKANDFSKRSAKT